MDNNNNEPVTFEDIKAEIEQYKVEMDIQLFGEKNNNGNYCCYFCEEVIRDMEFKCVAIGKYEWDRGIEYLACGIACPNVSEDLKGRCAGCGVVVDIGYYRDLPREMRCCDCERA
jgi:hypothetical protein